MPLESWTYYDAITLPASVDPMQPSSLHGFFGGVLDKDGRFIEESRHFRRGVIPIVYPPELTSQENQERKYISGRTLYAGPWFNHFGHFLLESTARLWPFFEDDFDHIVYQLPGGQLTMTSYQRDFLDVCDIPAKVLITDQRCRFEALTIPQPSFDLDLSADRKFCRLFDALRNSTASEDKDSDSPTKLYISRKNADLGVVVGEEIIEQAFVNAGFQSVSTELISMEERIRLFRSARCIAGVQGSNLHNLLLAQPGTQVLTIIRDKDALLTFRLIDKVRGVNNTYIQGVSLGAELHPPLSAQGPFLTDFQQLRQELVTTTFAYVAQHLVVLPPTAMRDRFVAEWEYVYSRYFPDRYNFSVSQERVMKARAVGYPDLPSL